MRTLGRATASVLGVVAVLILVAAISLAVVHDPGLVGPFATALGAVVAVVMGRAYEKRLELRAENRKQLEPIYEEFFQRLQESKFVDGDAKSAKFMTDLQRKFLLRASGSVLHAWVRWQRLIKSNQEAEDGIGVSMFIGLAGFIRAMRTDLGHDDSKLADRDLLRLFIPDIDDYIDERGRAIERDS